MAKFSPGDRVELRCWHVKSGERVNDWMPGRVVQADHRMAAIQLDVDVFSNNGWPIADRVLWAAHGSPNLRPAQQPESGNHASS